MPLPALSRRALIRLAAAAAVGLLAFGWAMARVSRPLHPNTIVALELAFTPENAAAILESWGDGGRHAARQSLLLDVPFIVLGYAPLLACLSLLSAFPREDRARSWALWLAKGALVAGVFDLIENAALLGVTGASPPSLFLTWTAGFAAAVKFVLVFAAVGFVLWFGLGRALARVTPLVQWFLSAPLLVAIAALVLAILWRAARAALGIPDLFWAESPFMQILAGVGVGALLGHLGILGFLLDTQRASRLGSAYCSEWSARIAVRWIVRYLPTVREAPVLLAGYLLRTSLPLLVIALASALRAPGGVSPWWLPFGAIVSCAVSAVISVWLSYRRLPLVAPEAVRARVQAAGFENLHRVANALVFVQLIVYATMWALYRFFEQGVSVALAVCVLLGAIGSLYGFLKYFFPAYAYGLLAGAFVVYVALNAPGGHHLPNLDYYNRVRLNRGDAHMERAPRVDPYLEAWKKSRGGQAPLVVVAVDGGGIRAAVWTTVVMAQLERDLPSFPYSVRVVTGASGGMVGIASYIGSLQPPDAAERHRDLDTRPLMHADLVDRVATDSLGTVARELVFKDMILPPFLHPTSDRGLALERAWEKSTRILGQRFADLGPGEAAGWRPSLIVSPLIVEDGRRLLISNLDVGDLTTVPVQPTSLQALEYFGHIEPRPGTLRLGTAVRLNASFPYVSPAAELPTDPARHTLDAGYYDEHGVELAGTWIWARREWLLANTTGVLLVQVPDARARARKQKASEDRRDWWGAGLLGVTAPVEALRTSQSAATDYRNDQLVNTLEATLNVGRPGFFSTVVFEPDETSAAEPPPGCGRAWIRRIVGGEEQAFRDIALSWRLTGCEVSRLKQAIRGGDTSSSCADRRRFQDWWNAHKRATDPAVSVTCPPAPL